MSQTVFDRAHFAMMTGDDAALQSELSGIFREQSEIWLRLLIPDAPTPIWRDAAHTVKGAARGLGLFALADACEEAELLGRAGAIEGKPVSQCLRRVRDRLREAVGVLSTETTDAAA